VGDVVRTSLYQSRNRNDLASLSCPPRAPSSPLGLDHTEGEGLSTSTPSRPHHRPSPLARSSFHFVCNLYTPAPLPQLSLVDTFHRLSRLNQDTHSLAPRLHPTSHPAYVSSRHLP
jgi:hypothetical protein